MKQCPRCKNTYSDDQLNFCLDDGELLTAVSQEPPPARYVDDPPPTMMMNDARVTNPTNWPAAPPPAAWQGQTLPAQQAQYAPFAMVRSASQSLAIASLCLGISSITVGWCCSLGLLLAPAALITGFIAISQIKKDPARFTGRNLAIGGIATGAAYFALLILFIVVWGAATFFGGLH